MGRNLASAYEQIDRGRCRLVDKVVDYPFEETHLLGQADFVFEEVTEPLTYYNTTILQDVRRLSNDLECYLEVNPDNEQREKAIKSLPARIIDRGYHEEMRKKYPKLLGKL